MPQILDDFSNLEPERSYYLMWFWAALAVYGWICFFPELWSGPSLVIMIIMAVAWLGVVLGVLIISYELFSYYKKQGLVVLCLGGWWYSSYGMFLKVVRLEEVFYFLSAYEVNVALSLLLVLELEVQYNKNRLLWRQTRLLPWAYFLTWGIMMGLKQGHVETGYWPLIGYLLPLSVALLLLLVYTWPILRTLSLPKRLLWWGLWMGMYLLGLSTGFDWQDEQISVVIGMDGLGSLINASNIWRAYGMACRGAGLLLLALVYLGAAYQAFYESSNPTPEP